MPDYHKMYLHVFNELTKIIDIAQNAQSKAEELYINATDTPIAFVQKGEDKE